MLALVTAVQPVTAALLVPSEPENGLPPVLSPRVAVVSLGTIRTAHNIAQLVTGVLFGVRAMTGAEANGVWAMPNPNDVTGRFFADADSSVTASCTTHTPAHTASGLAHAHASNPIGPSWLFAGEVSAVPVASGRDDAFAHAFARNKTAHVAKIDQSPPKDAVFGAEASVDWSITFGYEIHLGVITNLSELITDPPVQPTLTQMNPEPLRFDRGDLTRNSARYEFGYSNLFEDGVEFAGDVDIPVFAYDVWLDPSLGIQMSGSIDFNSPLVTHDPNTADGVDWIEISGVYSGQFTLSGTVTSEPWPTGGVTVSFDTYSQYEREVAVPEPSITLLLTAGLIGIHAARSRRVT